MSLSEKDRKQLIRRVDGVARAEAALAAARRDLAVELADVHERTQASYSTLGAIINLSKQRVGELIAAARR